jgi:hypothetical protein
MSDVKTDPESPPEPEGIVIELARDDVERKKFLRMAGKTMGSAAAATGLAAFIAACGSSSKKKVTKPSTSKKTSTTSTTSTTPTTTNTDLDIVNYALTLEYLEATFYKEVIAKGLFALHKVASELGMPAAKPKFKFPLTSAAAVEKLAATVENLGAAAYLGQAPRIKSPEILAAALAIHSVEGRHAATLNDALHLSPTPDGAFATPASMAQVLPIAKQFIVS